MHTAVISNLDLVPYFSLRKSLESSNPIRTVGTLNSMVVVNTESSELEIGIQTLSSFMKVSISIAIESNNFPMSKFGIQIELEKLGYAFDQYKNSYKEIKLIFEEEENGKFVFLILSKTDKIVLPIGQLSFAQIKNMNEIFTQKKALADASSIKFSMSNPEDKLFLLSMQKGFENSFSFLGKDENNYNACALYVDKIIVNDLRHVFIYHFPSSTPKFSSFIPIHKKNMKFIYDTMNSETEYTLSIFSEETGIFISTDNLVCFLNNGIADTIPPTEEDLMGIRPSNKVFSTALNTLLSSIEFFDGFYSSRSELRALTFEVNEKNELLFYLKDKGIGGYGSFSVEKVIPATNAEMWAVTSSPTTIIQDSIKLFLLNAPIRGEKEIVVDLYMEDEKPAVYLTIDNMEIYLSILQG